MPSRLVSALALVALAGCQSVLGPDRLPRRRPAACPAGWQMIVTVQPPGDTLCVSIGVGRQASPKIGGTFPPED